MQEKWQNWHLQLYEESFCLCKFNNPETVNVENLEEEFMNIRQHYGLDALKMHIL